MLSEGVVLKFVPVMVTAVPTGPDIGVKEVMVGGNVPPVELDIVAWLAEPAWAKTSLAKTAIEPIRVNRQ